MRFPKIHHRTRSVEASGQLLSVQTVIRHTKTHPVLPSCMSLVHPSPWPNVLSCCLEWLPLSLMNHFIKEKKNHPGTEENFKKFAAFSLPKSKLPVTSPVKRCPSLFCFIFSWLSFPSVSIYFPHSTHEFCGYNETFRGALRVRGHDANSGFTACVSLCVCVLVLAGRTAYL